MLNSLIAQFRLARLGIVASVCLLAACASTQGPNSADPNAQALLGQPNDEYAYNTQSDPLGAYLANRGKADIATTYSRSNQPQQASQSHHFANKALDYLGIKYTYGGNAPTSGFDCSGLVSYVAEKSLGVKLPRQSAQMARQGKSIKQKHLQKGDLVFFNTTGQRNSHVGIYLGDNQFVHAPRTGAVVRVEDMTISYWQQRYNGARRLASK